MEYMRIAIITEDKAYGEALARALLIGNRNFDLTLMGCSEFCRRMQDGGKPFQNGYDLVLWDEEGAEKVCGGNLIWLTERRSETGHLAKDHFTIYKYSPMTVLLGEIYSIYEKLTGRRAAGTRPDRMEVIAFVSWQGGCGCTTLSMAVAQDLVRFEGSRVLYLSMEGTESSPLFMEMPPGMKTIGEYLYHLSAEKEDQSPFLEGYLIRDDHGTESFAASGSCNPLSNAGREEIDRLLPALMDSGRFDCIVIDVGNGTGEAQRSVLPYADRICLVSSRVEPEREMRYRAFLRHGLEKDVAGRLIRVYNRTSGSGTGTPPDAVTISEIETPGPGILLEGSFGCDVQKLVQLCYNQM